MRTETRLLIVEIIAILLASASMIAFIWKTKRASLERKEKILKNMNDFVNHYYIFPYQFRDPERETDPEQKILKKAKLHSLAIYSSILWLIGSVLLLIFLVKVIYSSSGLQDDDIGTILALFPLAIIFVLISVLHWLRAYLMIDTGYVDRDRTIDKKKK